VGELAYFLIALSLGYGLARWSARPGVRSDAQAVGGVVLWLSALTLTTQTAVFQVVFAPAVITRFVRIAIHSLWPHFAHQTFDIEWVQILLPQVIMMILSQLSLKYGLMGAAVGNAVFIGLLLAAAHAIRPVVPGGAGAALRRILPRFLRRLADNPWSSGEPTSRRWDINLCLIVLSTIPAVPIGPLAALYLRVRAPALLWPASWIASLWSLAYFVPLGVRWTLSPIIGGYLSRMLIADLLTALVLGILLCATVPTTRATRGSRATLVILIILAVCFQLIPLGLLPGQIGDGGQPIGDYWKGVFEWIP
jgi:hypothetical protein